MWVALPALVEPDREVCQFVDEYQQKAVLVRVFVQGDDGFFAPVGVPEVTQFACPVIPELKIKGYVPANPEQDGCRGGGKKTEVSGKIIHWILSNVKMISIPT